MCFPYHYSNLTAIEGYPICLMMTSCNQSFNIIHITRLNLDQIPFIVILFPTCTCLVWVRHSIDLNVKLCKFYVWKVKGLRGFNYVHWWTQPSCKEAYYTMFPRRICIGFLPNLLCSASPTKIAPLVGLYDI